MTFQRHFRANGSGWHAAIVSALCFGAIIFSPTAQSQIVINEINYAPSGSDNPAEFVELYNHSTNSVDLSGWVFDAGIDFTFPTATILSAGSYLVISGAPGKFATRWGFTPLGPWDGKLANEGEQVRLRDAANNTVDSVTYGAGFPWPTAASGDGSSMELIHPELDNDLGGSWRSSGQPAGTGEPQVFIPPTDVAWRFRKGTNEASSPTSAWRQPAFVEDNTWSTARTSIGYGDNDDNTILTDMQNRYTSMFLRRVFNIEPGAKPNALKLRVRVDDGCIVWINGTEAGRFHVNAGLNPAYNSTAQNHEADAVNFEEMNIADAGGLLLEGDNVIAVQAFNGTMGSSDFTIDVSLEELPSSASATPTPGAVNSVFALNAPPAVRQVAHIPEQPASGQVVTVTAKVTDPDGVASVALKYQPVNPGAYIRRTDAEYSTNWTSLPMFDDGTHGDLVAGDFIYTTEIPGDVQTHRRFVRYRIVASDAAAQSIELPYADDGSPNFAYYVHDGFPAWTGAFQPGVTANVTYPPSLLESLPTYQLIARSNDVVNSQYNSGFNGQRFWGTLVYEGVVYDHLQFNNRGEASTYVSGKNKWRFHFNTAREFEARDNWGRRYGEKWDELNLNAVASPWCAVHRGMAGVEEAVSFRVYELLGMASSRTHFLHFRVIDDVSENSASQFQGGNPSGVNGGDLWGLYLAIEHPDASFLNDRALEDGNVYKIESSNGDKKHQGDDQSADDSDWNNFLAACKSPQTEAWWRTNLNLEAYYNFHAGNRIVGNVDVREGFNHYFYHAPDGWRVIPWDLDMMFIPKAHWSGIIDQTRCLDLPQLRIEFQNRARELLDLMCEGGSANGGQIGQLIDEYARMVAPLGQPVNWVGLDAAMWNYNPRTRSDSGNSQTDHLGSFFKTPFQDRRIGGTWTRTLATPDFNGSMKYLVDYSTDTFPITPWTLNNGDSHGYGYEYLATESGDVSAPQRPAAAYVGAAGFPVDDLRFSAGAFAGSNNFAAAQWRAGEISAPGIPFHDPGKPRIYEVTDVWRSSELPSNGVVRIPPAALRVGHTYRVRVRHKDVSGRWSRWSPAVQFIAAPVMVGLTAQKIVISEFMYNPPALTPTELDAGFTDRQLFEYVEVLNISSNVLELDGAAFIDGITYGFDAGTTLAPGERVLVAKDTNAFALRYGNIGRVVGPFSGNLDNAGERVLLTSEGQPVQDFTYSDGNHPPGSDPWPTAADGDGSSLVLMNPELAPYHNDVNNWRASIRIPGSPGRADLINFVEWSRRFPGIGAPSDDSDGDGASEQAEYFFGTSPTDSADKPGPISGELETLSVGGQDDVYLVFTFTRPLENEDVDYIVEFSMDLLTWPLVGVYLGLLDNGNGTVTERWRGAQPITDTESLFVRLRAQFR